MVERSKSYFYKLHIICHKIFHPSEGVDGSLSLGAADNQKILQRKGTGSIRYNTAATGTPSITTERPGADPAGHSEGGDIQWGKKFSAIFVVVVVFSMHFSSVRGGNGGNFPPVDPRLRD